MGREGDASHVAKTMGAQTLFMAVKKVMDPDDVIDIDFTPEPPENLPNGDHIPEAEQIDSGAAYAPVDEETVIDVDFTSSELGEPFHITQRGYMITSEAAHEN